jgi:SAM-dependent methyltransferase
VDFVLDIRRLGIAGASLDAVVALHVLEHVDDDRAALAEIRRVLRPGGVAILAVPADPARATTDEDLSVTDPAERLRRFGHEGHVRVYGRDFAARVAAAGFEVSEVDARRFGAARFGLLAGESVVFGLARRS